MDKLRSDIAGLFVGFGGLIVSAMKNPQKLIVWLTIISLMFNILLSIKRLVGTSKK